MNREKNIKNAGILGNLDLFVLETACISIDRLRKIEQQINEKIKAGIVEQTKETLSDKED